MPEQKTDLLEGRRLREIVDVVAAVGEHTAIAIEITDRGRGRDNVFKSAFSFLGGSHLDPIL